MWLDDLNAYKVGKDTPLTNCSIGGIGQGCFIGRKAHLPAIDGSQRFNKPRWFCVAPGKMDHRWVQMNRPDVTLSRIATDYQWMFDAMLETEGTEFVENHLPVNTFPTKMHPFALRTAAAAGCKSAVSEKPLNPLGNIKEAVELRNDLQQMPWFKAYLAWQHFKNWAMYVLRREIENDPEAIEALFGFFLQKWLMTDPKCQQEEHRACDKTCAADDIGTHAQHGCRWLGGSPLEDISNVTMEMAGEHARKRKFYDRSAWDYTLKNGIHGRCQVSQSTPGHQDDIHFHVKKKDGSQLLWRMPWGTETLWYAPPKSEVSLEKVDGWEPHNRCNTDRFQHEDIDAIFDMMSPPEHIQGWHMFMLYFYADVLGDTYKRTDDPIYEYLPPAFKTHDVAGIDDGVEMTAAVAGLLHVFEGENKTANIPDLIAAAS